VNLSGPRFEFIRLETRAAVCVYSEAAVKWMGTENARSRAGEWSLEKEHTMASQEVLNAIEPLAYERDRQEFALGDTLDIKTGLILAALTFLAIQSGELIHSGLPLSQQILQYISVGALILGGVLATLELWPIDYDREAPPDKYLDWLEAETQNQGISGSEAVASLLTKGRLTRTLERINTNFTANKRKSRFMRASFLFVVLSFAANVTTLFIRLLS
jgi:hypothetical protein